MPRLTTSSIVAAMSKYLRMPEGGTACTRWLRRLLIERIGCVWPLLPFL
jgi:hypothetical protein